MTHVTFRLTQPDTVARVAYRARQVVLNVAAFVGVLSIVVVVICAATGIRPVIVISGSMSPGIPVGALTGTRTVPAGSVAVGDVVTLPRTDGEGLVTHRIIETTPAAGTAATTLRLQGDANTEPDALPYAVTEVGQVLGSVPHLGRIVAGLQQNLIAVVAGLLLLTALATFPTSRRTHT